VVRANRSPASTLGDPDSVPRRWATPCVVRRSVWGDRVDQWTEITDLTTGSVIGEVDHLPVRWEPSEHVLRLHNGGTATIVERDDGSVGIDLADGQPLSNGSDDTSLPVAEVIDGKARVTWIHATTGEPNVFVPEAPADRVPLWLTAAQRLIAIDPGSGDIALEIPSMLGAVAGILVQSDGGAVTLFGASGYLVRLDLQDFRWCVAPLPPIPSDAATWIHEVDGLLYYFDDEPLRDARTLQPVDLPAANPGPAATRRSATTKRELTDGQRQALQGKLQGLFAQPSADGSRLVFVGADGGVAVYDRQPG